MSDDKKHKRGRRGGSGHNNAAGSGYDYCKEGKAAIAALSGGGDGLACHVSRELSEIDGVNVIGLTTPDCDYCGVKNGMVNANGTYFRVRTYPFDGYDFIRDQPLATTCFMPIKFENYDKLPLPPDGIRVVSGDEADCLNALIDGDMDDIRDNWSVMSDVITDAVRTSSLTGVSQNYADVEWFRGEEEENEAIKSYLGIEGTWSGLRLDDVCDKPDRPTMADYYSVPFLKQSGHRFEEIANMLANDIAENTSSDVTVESVYSKTGPGPQIYVRQKHSILPDKQIRVDWYQSARHSNETLDSFVRKPIVRITSNPYGKPLVFGNGHSFYVPATFAPEAIQKIADGDEDDLRLQRISDITNAVRCNKASYPDEIFGISHEIPLVSFA